MKSPHVMILENLRTTFRSIASVLRRTATERVTVRDRSHSVSRNFFLHMHSARTHMYTLRPGFTLGLGALSFSLFLILLVTGVLLMVYYVPSVERAYGSVKDLSEVVAGGRYIRNMHRWAAHGMVAVVVLHLLRVLFTSAYTGTRRVNWIVGILLLCTTVLFSFSGYLLPWDQLAFWAVTIASNIVASTRDATDILGITSLFDPGGFVRRLLLGADAVGQEALTRFYLLHVVLLPITAAVLIGVHFWRIRKSDGLAIPADADHIVLKAQGAQDDPDIDAARLRREHTVLSWPTTLWAEGAVFLAALACLMLAALLVDAPLLAPADPSMPENPAKSPWYFLGVQELVSYSAFSGGVLIPSLFLLAALAVPFVDREEEGTGVWFAGKRGRKVVLLSAVVASLATVGVLAVAIGAGWRWTHNAPPLVPLFINPGTILATLYGAWSWGVLRSTSSSKMGVFALAACSLAGGLIVTVVGIWLRGINWEFVW